MAGLRGSSRLIGVFRGGGVLRLAGLRGPRLASLGGRPRGALLPLPRRGRLLGHGGPGRPLARGGGGGAAVPQVRGRGVGGGAGGGRPWLHRGSLGASAASEEGRQPDLLQHAIAAVVDDEHVGDDARAGGGVVVAAVQVHGAGRRGAVARADQGLGIKRDIG